jgi:hypothetical protein
MGIFQTILADGIARGQMPGKTQTARDWYRAYAKDFGAKIRDTGSQHSGRIDYVRISETKFMNENKSALTSTIMPGSMYMFMYDPKYKETLPYYDRFPLIFPFRVQKDRFWGINLHYLPLNYRAILMDSLYELANNKQYDESTKLRLSWRLLNSAARAKYVKPCVKQYLLSHVDTRFMWVNPEYWDSAIFLPLERFEKKNKTQVWTESRKQIS